MKKIIFSPAFLVIWVIVIGAISYSLLQSLIGIRGSNARLTELQAKNTQMQQDIDNLKIKISKAETPFAKEKIIREELGLQLPGETVVQMNQVGVVGADGATPQPTASPAILAANEPQNQAKNHPIYRQWLELFFGL